MNNKHVVVVGGAGFLGSHVVQHLLEKGNVVTVLDNLCSGRYEFVPESHPNCMFFNVDITRADLKVFFRDTDYVFNYAALPFIPDSFDDPQSFMMANTVGALNVIEAAHKAGVERTLQVTSAEVYGNMGNGERINEHCPFGPPSTYATSKAAIDDLARARFKERGVPVIVLRQFNCVGERETHPYVIPEIINQIHSMRHHKTINIQLGENTQRDFLYAGDAAEMAIELLEKGKPGEAYNMGSENTHRIYDIAQMIAEIMVPGVELSIHYDEARKRPAEIYSLQSDNTKLYNTIQYRSRTSFYEALEKTVRYFNSNNHQWDF